MQTVVVSDVHLGSPHCRSEDFIRFVRSLPTDATLVLNGDTVHTHDSRHYPQKHQEALDMLKTESLKRRVVWVRGNHDESYVMEASEKIEFVPHYHIEKDLFMAHGNDFDNVMPYNRTFIILFRFIHHLRILLGAESIHVAVYAKRFPLLYRVLLRHVTMNAVEYAKENGYRAVACGHTHYVEDRLQDGIRYMNTGAWTEKTLHYLWVDDGTLEIRPVPDLRTSGSLH
jgi:UDP-2,3-diacylglucosamine pyrophosphatase LpxH